MVFLLLTKSSSFLIGPLSNLMGLLMNLIFNFTSSLGVENFGLCIILFTVIINLLMIPLNLKSQKSSKMMAVINPELRAIQAKYSGRNDQESMMRMRAETSAVYEKYGVSMASGCLPMAIQLPILYALYPVIRNIPAYVSGAKSVFMTVATAVMSQSGWLETISELATKANGVSDVSVLADNPDRVIDMLNVFDGTEWTRLTELFPAIKDTIQPSIDRILNMNYFFGGINLAEAPGLRLTPALLIPICAGLFQWISTKLITANQPAPASTGSEGDMGASMQMMNNFFPLMSVAMCISLPAGLGIYWAASSGVRCIIQFFTNRYLNKLDVNKMIEANIAKKNAQRAKKGLPPISSTVKNGAPSKTFKELEEENREKFKEANAAPQVSKETEARIKRSSEYYEAGTEKPDSIAARARMVQKFNEKKGKQ